MWTFAFTVLANFYVMLIFNYIWLIWVAITHNLWIMLMKFTDGHAHIHTHIWPSIHTGETMCYSYTNTMIISIHTLTHTYTYTTALSWMDMDFKFHAWFNIPHVMNRQTDIRSLVCALCLWLIKLYCKFYCFAVSEICVSMSMENESFVLLEKRKRYCFLLESEKLRQK